MGKKKKKKKNCQGGREICKRLEKRKQKKPSVNNVRVGEGTEVGTCYKTRKKQGTCQLGPREGRVEKRKSAKKKTINGRTTLLRGGKRAGFVILAGKPFIIKAPRRGFFPEKKKEDIKRLWEQ